MATDLCDAGLGWVAVALTVGIACGGSIVVVDGDAGIAAGYAGTIGGSCTSVAPCGGDIVGTWIIISSCAGTASSTANATCETVTVPWSTNSGASITFGSDGTYQAFTGLTGTQTASVPNSCLAASGITCGQYETMLNDGSGAQGGGPSPLVTSASCQYGTSNDTCDCSIMLFSSATSYGMYTTSGSTVTTSPALPSSATSGTGSYCVQGSTLYLSFGPSGVPGSGAATGNLVATKQ